MCVGYFAGALSPKALKTFFVDVAEGSPIPVSSASGYSAHILRALTQFDQVIVYNYPGASAGIDLNSDLIAESKQRTFQQSSCSYLPSYSSLQSLPLHLISSALSLLVAPLASSPASSRSAQTLPFLVDLLISWDLVS